MDALIASAGPLNPAKKRRTRPPVRSFDAPHKTISRGEGAERIDASTHSILAHTRLPGGFQPRTLASGSGDAPLKPDKSVGRIGDKKLRAQVARTDVAAKRARREREDVNEWLNAPLAGSGGGIEVDEEMEERTWRVRQEDIVQEVGEASARKKFDLRFEDMGSYRVDYTRNGRHLAIASTKGHVATFDWQAGKLLSEIQLRESVRDIKFLQSESFYAVAQKKYIFVYDKDGVELHKLKQHLDPTHMEYLPYHYLLASVGHAGHLKYHDVSTGTLLTQIPTHFGSPTSMTHNAHSAILHLGHANGTMTLWSPNLSTPHVKLLAHRGPVSALAVDPSEASAGRYTATAGLDGFVKLWDARMWGKEVRSIRTRNAPSSLSFSDKGMLAIGSKSGVTVYRDLARSADQPREEVDTAPYLTLPMPGLSADRVRFCPFDDVLAVGHGRGISSLLVPGAGEANFDSAEADVFESHTRRREREVRGVLEKIRPELITMDTEFLGTVREERPNTFEEREGRSYRQLGRMERLRREGEDVDGTAEERATGLADSADEEEEGATSGRPEKKKKKMRGKGGSTSRYLTKKNKKNIVDSSLIQMRVKAAAQAKKEDERQRIERGELVKEVGALARFG